MSDSLISNSRIRFLLSLCQGVLTKNEEGVPSNADKNNRNSRRISSLLLDKIGGEIVDKKLPGQTAGTSFEIACSNFLNETFLNLSGLRPGKWIVGTPSQLELSSKGIAEFEQYHHLAILAAIAKKEKDIKVAIGSDYLIKPDVIVAREPEDDLSINVSHPIVDKETGLLTAIRKHNQSSQILHASVSCKWTMRSDRSQNSRTEALNLIRNRKGRVPHIVAVTAEPMPSRIASLALGTGDVDCVYHIALPELQESVKELELGDAQDMLEVMIEGRRLRDISDLPLDLCI